MKNVKDAKFIESLISQNDLKSFVCSNRDDLKLFLDEVCYSVIISNKLLLHFHTEEVILILYYIQCVVFTLGSFIINLVLIGGFRAYAVSILLYVVLYSRSITFQCFFFTTVGARWTRVGSKWCGST